MKRLTNWLRVIGMRSLVTVMLAALMLVVSPVFQSSQSLQAQASPQMTSQDQSSDKMIKKIQQEAEDLGDSPDRPIGQTGLKNIKKLGENFKETVDLNVRQKGAIYNSDVDDKVGALEKGQKETERNAK